ncbi:MAG: hypothetical protein UT32_C0011G0019 [Parcubacteria group bacterium GW2011_GWC2_39_14]|nr:MAG: hypothetical protein UT32_C0011G0019 [Parcubacteria group bacterium GW2011_GWC2_39_14]
MNELEVRSAVSALILEVLGYLPGLWYDLGTLTETVQVRTPNFVQPYLYSELCKLISPGKVLERLQTDDEFQASSKPGIPVARDYLYRLVG